MTCPRISHAVPLQADLSAAGSHRSRRVVRRGRETSDSFQVSTASGRLSQSLCSETRGTPSATSILSIPGALRSASRFTAAASDPDSRTGARSDLDRAVEAYNGAVRTWRTYELSRPAGSPPSAMVRSLEWDGIREGLLAAAAQQGFRLSGLEESPSDQILFRPEEGASNRMSDREVSGAVLQLTRIRNRIRALDLIEDDPERSMRDRLSASRSGLNLVRQAAEIFDRLESAAPNPHDARIVRLRSELLHVACDDPNTAEVAQQTGPEWVAHTVRLYNQSAEGAIRGVNPGRVDAGYENPILRARLHLTRARRASVALRFCDDVVAGEALSGELNQSRIRLERELLGATRRVVSVDVREARRLLARADAVLGHPGRSVSPARLEAARADYRRGLEILNRLSEFSATNPQVARLRHDGRWARLESAANAAA